MRQSLDFESTSQHHQKRTVNIQKLQFEQDNLFHLITLLCEILFYPSEAGHCSIITAVIVVRVQEDVRLIPTAGGEATTQLFHVMKSPEQVQEMNMIMKISAVMQQQRPLQ